jgi:hypothetical protein
MALYKEHITHRIEDDLAGRNQNWAALDGSVIESGSNTNGTWIRFSSGLQICFGSFTLPSVSTAWGQLYMTHSGSRPGVTFPKSFRSGTTPQVITSPTDANLYVSALSSITHSGFVGNAVRGTAYENPVTFSYCAMGVWKA